MSQSQACRCRQSDGAVTFELERFSSSTRAMVRDLHVWIALEKWNVYCQDASEGRFEQCKIAISGYIWVSKAALH